MNPKKPHTFRRMLAAVVISALGLTACAQIPVGGKVSSLKIDVPDPGLIYLSVNGPVTGADPEQIVEGFISAQVAGQKDDWKVAKEFLTPAAAAKWQPVGHTTVFAGELLLKPAEPSTTGEDHADGKPEGQTADQTEGSSDDPGDPSAGSQPTATSSARAVSVEGTINVSATIDANGIYAEAVPDAQSKLNFDLIKDHNGQWRISTVADGYYISQPIFHSQFRPVSVYFLSRDEKYLVPEIRWFWRTRAETYAVNALLAGPSEWLRDAVTTAIPSGTRLVYDSVSVDANGMAHVNLSAEALTASAADRSNLTSQIEATLLRLPGVRSVDIQVSSVDFQQNTNPELIRDPILASTPIVLTGDRLQRLSGRTVEPLETFDSLAGLDVTGLSLDETQTYGALRLGKDQLVTIPVPGEQPVTLMTGKDLVAPSIDRFGWIWSGESLSTPNLRAVTRDGTEVQVRTNWLAERSIIDIKVSHDGARIAIISAVGDQSQIEVAAVIRDGSNVPQSLSDPVTVGSALGEATLMQWLDESTLAVVGHSSTSDLESLFTVTVGGRSEMISNVNGAVSMGTGRGLRSLFIGTNTGEILSRTSTGASWSTVLEDASLPTFPG